MKKVRLLCLTLLFIVGTGSAAHAAGKGTSLIVMPVRYTVVQFAFDVARIRPVELLAYDKGVGDDPLLLHVWDVVDRDWKPADLAAYRAGTLFATSPKRAFLVGTDEDLPAELADGTAWCKDVIRIGSLKVIDMANSMSSELRFSGKEWKMLAKRHKLKLVDDNAERRRYGRYGKPGTTPTRPRPVNPLIARFRRSKQSGETVAPMGEEESIEVECIEDPPEEAVEEAPSEEAPALKMPVVEVPAGSPAEEKGVPSVEVKAAAPVPVEAEPPAVMEAEAPAEVAPLDPPAEFK